MRRSSHPDILPSPGRKTDSAAMMELLLDMSSQIIAMEECMAQHEQADYDQFQWDDAVRRGSPGLQLGMREGA